MRGQIWESIPHGPNADKLIGPSVTAPDDELGASGSVFSLVRVIEGRVSGLGSKWFGGSAKVLPGQLRISGLAIPVETVRLATAYRAGLRHHDHKPLAAVQIESRDAVLEWLLPEEQLEAAMRRIGGGRHPAVLDRDGLVSGAELA